MRESQPSVHEEYRKLTIDEIKRVIFLSFMFSQGNTYLQECILIRIRGIYGLQRPLSDIQKDELNQYMFEVLKKLIKVGGHEFLDIGLDGEDFSDVAPSNFFDLLTDTTPRLSELDKSALMVTEDHPFYIEDTNNNSILGLMIYADSKFRKRKNRKKIGLDTESLRDRHMSVFINYIIRDAKTGDRAFDLLIQSLKSSLSNWFLDYPEIKKPLFAVINNFNKTHSNKITESELVNAGFRLSIADKIKLGFYNEE